MKQELLWGIDLGGTKIECSVLDSSNFNVLYRERLATESAKGADHILSRIKTLVDDAKITIGSQPQIIGIATPGTLDSETELLKNSNTTCLNGLAVKKELETLLGIPIVMANDANCFALAETLLGVIPDKCPQAEVVFGVILGTGVGGGIVVNGQVLNGAHGIGGEWGHIRLETPGNNCYCGSSGCVETVISGPALEKFYKNHSGNSLPLNKIAELVSNDKNAAATLERLIEMFSKAICQVINVLDPDAIVIGGGVGNLDQIYEECPREIEKYIFNHHFKGKLLKPKLGDSAGVFGAAMLTINSNLSK